MKNQGIVPKNGVWARNVASAAAADVVALQWCHLRVSALRAAVPHPQSLEGNILFTPSRNLS